jgi:hypothetical protein
MIGAALHSALMARVGANSQHQQGYFVDFFICRASPISGTKIAASCIGATKVTRKNRPKCGNLGNCTVDQRGVTKTPGEWLGGR